MAVDRKYGKVNVPGIPDDEPVVIFPASNITTPRVLDEAATLAKAAGYSDRHVAELRGASEDIRDWQSQDDGRTVSPWEDEAH